ncbi:MAG: hypothetical protein KDA92_06830 [Planctomycetales bacterium]|nr:hypothetical protein [Planctomycetales bacterium]
MHELDRIQRMLQGEQRLAAIEKIDALLAQHPDRPSLLMIKLETQLAMDEAEAAVQTLDRLVEVDVKNPSVPAMQALVAIVGKRDLAAAVNYLQDAFERSDGNLPSSIYHPLLLVAQMFARVGLPLAAKGHAQLIVALSEGKDEQSAQALMRLNQARNIPQILREPMNLYGCPENVTWRIEFDSAMRDIYRGRWRVAARHLSAMAIRILDAPAILYNLAIVYGWLGDNEKAVKSLQDFARIRDVPLDERVHALAVAEALGVDRRHGVEIVELTFPLADFEAFSERCVTSPQLVAVDVDSLDLQDEDQPRPRAIYSLLDRNKPADNKVPSVDEVPVLLGSILLYGKQTDRDAQLVLNASRPQVAAARDAIAQITGVTLGEPSSEQQAGFTNWTEAQVFRKHYFAPERTPDQMRLLHLELRRQAIFNRLPDEKCPFLDDKTPREAAQDNKYKPVLLAHLLNMELALQEEIDLNPLRKDLGLPEIEAIDAATGDFDRAPVHRLGRVDVTKLSDEQLLSVYRRSYAVMAVGPLRHAAAEVVNRESLEQKIDKVEAYDILSDIASSSDDALAYLEKARKLATQEGDSPAAWLVDEMELRLIRREFERFVQLFKEIESRYLKEPGIAQAMLQVLSRFGLVTPDGRVMMPVPKEAAESADGKLWTPDSEPSATSGDSSGSKLWVPGMD